MPIKYDILEEQNLILATGSDVVTAKDVISHLDSLATEDKYIAPMKKLVDYRTRCDVCGDCYTICPANAVEIVIDDPAN